MFRAWVLLASVISSISAVLNGLWTPPQDMLSSASLLIRFPGVPDSSRVLCGGVLISPSVVLTSAHCFTQRKTESIAVNVTLADYNLYSPDLYEQNLISWAFRKIPEPIRHTVDDDLAVVFLPGPRPVCQLSKPTIARLPLTTEAHPDPATAFYTRPITDEELTQSVCTTAGWGLTEKNIYSHVPMTTMLKIEFRNFTGFPGPVMVATSNLPYTKTCHGDSGSPVFCWLRGARYLVGILSEIGADEEFMLRANATEAEECAAKDFVMVSDLRKRMGAVEGMLKEAGQGGQLEHGQKMCGYWN